MPSEQKGAYGGHLALSDIRHEENDVMQTAYVPPGRLPFTSGPIAPRQNYYPTAALERAIP